jgi:tight adherence protein B
MDRMLLLLTAAAASLFTWGTASTLMKLADEWRRRMLEETELELQEMLLMVEAQQIMNFSLVAAFVGGIISFFIASMVGGTWNPTSGAIFGAAVFAVFLFVPRVLVRVLRARRREKFNDQLEEALLSMSNALKAGFSIQQAIDMVIRQRKQPISLEFRLMMQQTRLGMSMDDALHNMARRVQSEDFDLVCSAIATARVTGGDLTGVLQRLAELIRERLRIHRQVKSKTAQGRLQGMMLGLLPIMLFVALIIVAPHMVDHFFAHPLGVALLVLALLLEGGGYFAIRRIVDIDV